MRSPNLLTYPCYKGLPEKHQGWMLGQKRGTHICCFILPLLKLPDIFQGQPCRMHYNNPPRRWPEYEWLWTKPPNPEMGAIDAQLRIVKPVQAAVRRRGELSSCTLSLSGSVQPIQYQTCYSLRKRRPQNSEPLTGFIWNLFSIQSSITSRQLNPLRYFNPSFQHHLVGFLLHVHPVFLSSSYQGKWIRNHCLYGKIIIGNQTIQSYVHLSGKKVCTASNWLHG